MFTSNQVVFLFPGLEHHENNSLLISLLSVGIVVFILFLNIFGLRTSAVFNNISGLVTYASVALNIVIGVISWIRFGPATDMSVQNWLPRLGNVKSLVFLSIIVYMFARLESASMLGDEVHNASRTIPRALVTSGIIITCLYILSTFSLMLAVSPDHLSDLTGTPTQ
jgi:amino acid transporter